MATAWRPGKPADPHKGAHGSPQCRRRHGPRDAAVPAWARFPEECYLMLLDEGWTWYIVDDFGNLVESTEPFDGVL